MKERLEWTQSRCDETLNVYLPRELLNGGLTTH